MERRLILFFVVSFAADVGLHDLDAKNARPAGRQQSARRRTARRAGEAAEKKEAEKGKPQAEEKKPAEKDAAEKDAAEKAEKDEKQPPEEKKPEEKAAAAVAARTGDSRRVADARFRRSESSLPHDGHAHESRGGLDADRTERSEISRYRSFAAATSAIS